MTSSSSPPLWSTIAIEPLLPTVHEQRAQRSPLGGIVKCVLSYERAFWREAGLSGDAVSDASIVTTTMDTTHGSRPALVAFVVGEEARRWSTRDPEARKAAVLEAMGRFFGSEARSPRTFLEQDWSRERFTHGCPVSLLGRRARGRGTGDLEGALEAAERVAREILG